MFMKFLVGILAAVVVGVIAGLAMFALDIEAGFLSYAIVGILGFGGFSLAQAAYDKVRKGKEKKDEH